MSAEGESPGGDYDLIVVGAGTAGLPCALSAAAHGRVLLVEKDSHVGGTLHLSSGHLSAAGTRRQAARGIVDTPDQHLQDIKRLNGDTARNDILARAVGLAGATVDWLDDCGFDFTEESPESPSDHEAYSVPRSYQGVEQGMSILRILREQLDAAMGSGSVELLTSTPLVGLMQDDAGAVSGVRVLTPTGQEKEFRSSAVVLATGGFSANPELFAEIEGRPLVSTGRLTSTGDGLVIARALGAGIAGQGTYLPTFGGLPDPKSAWRSPLYPRATLNASVRPPWEVYVDRHGQRFVAEDTPGTDAKERALSSVDDLTFWVVFDSRAVAESEPLVPGWREAELKEASASRPGVHISDTWSGLADLCGIDPAGLEATLLEYNRAITEDGPDPKGRTFRPAAIAQPPFYALRNHGVTLVVFSGLDVDSDLRVRRTDGSVIHGLYAIGELLGNGATAGNAFCSGMQVTPAITLGRWLGSRLAGTWPASRATDSADAIARTTGTL